MRYRVKLAMITAFQLRRLRVIIVCYVCFEYFHYTLSDFRARALLSPDMRTTRMRHETLIVKCHASESISDIDATTRMPVKRKALILMMGMISIYADA